MSETWENDIYERKLFKEILRIIKEIWKIIRNLKESLVKFVNLVFNGNNYSSCQ